MVLQRLEGLSDREAVDRFAFDVRWKYAAGGLELRRTRASCTRSGGHAGEAAGLGATRIGSSSAVLDVAKEAGVVGRRRVLDSTPLYDAVATQDTVTMIRAAIRGLLRVAAAPLATELRGVLKRDDDYATAGKPVCDWEDKAAREALIDALARDAYAVLLLLDGRELAAEVKDAAALVATVVRLLVATFLSGAIVEGGKSSLARAGAGRDPRRMKPSPNDVLGVRRAARPRRGPEPGGEAFT